MQLDIFEHSRDVMLRNTAIDALWDRHPEAAALAIGGLVAEYPDDAMLPVLHQLCARLALRAAAPLNRASAGEVVRATEATVAAVRKVFGKKAEIWLAPFWAELAAAIKGLPFDAREEALHAAPFLLRAGKWVDACAALESIPSWRRQPAPLAWKIEAGAKFAGVSTLWPFLAELSWMAPRQARALADHLKVAELTAWVRGFDAQFEGEGAETVNDFAWFPAWVLIAHPQLAASFVGAQAGADTAPERCARLVLNLLQLERQGAHDRLIDARKKLRDTHRMLFDRYMQSRSTSLIR
jgi:hypothetical protein